MKFCALKLLLRQQSNKAFRFSRSYSSVLASDIIFKDFKKIWESGKAPEKFNFSKDVFDKHVATRPSALALWFDTDQHEEQKWTFSELQTESIRSGVFIRNILNLPNSTSTPKKSPFILTVLPRIPEWWFFHLAAIRVGTIFSPGTTMLTTEDIQYRLEASGAEMIITDEENMRKVNEAFKGLGDSKVSKNLKKVVVGKSGNKVSNLLSGWIDYEEHLMDVQDSDVLSFKDTDTGGDQVAQGYFTSGTTGKPKMVAHTHASYGIGHYTTAKMMGLKETDVHWNISDPGWAKASYSNFFAPWTAGSTVYINQMPRFEARKVLKILTEKPITTFCGPPTLYKSMVQESDKSLFQFPSLRYAVGAGEAVSNEVTQIWKKKTGVRLDQLYGQTEMTATDPETAQKGESLGIVGMPNAHYDIRITDDQGVECPRGTEGLLAIKVKPLRPIGLFKGYLKGSPNGPVMDSDKNASVFVGDFYLTGDGAYIDESGHLFCVGRADDVISSSGYRIGPTEIESVLQTHPAVVESACVASPCPDRGEVVKAFIVLSTSYQTVDKLKLQKEMQDYVKSKTAPYKYPRRVEFVDSLPKTVSGKILRRELKRQEYSKLGQ